MHIIQRLNKCRKTYSKQDIYLRNSPFLNVYGINNDLLSMMAFKS